MDIHERLKDIQTQIDFAKSEVTKRRQETKQLQSEIRDWLNYIKRKKEERHTLILKSMTTQ